MSSTSPSAFISLSAHTVIRDITSTCIVIRLSSLLLLWSSHSWKKDRKSIAEIHFIVCLSSSFRSCCFRHSSDHNKTKLPQNLIFESNSIGRCLFTLFVFVFVASQRIISSRANISLTKLDWNAHATIARARTPTIQLYHLAIIAFFFLFRSKHFDDTKVRSIEKSWCKKQKSKRKYSHFVARSSRFYRFENSFIWTDGRSFIYFLFVRRAKWYSTKSKHMLQYSEVSLFLPPIVFIFSHFYSHSLPLPRRTSNLCRRTLYSRIRPFLLFFLFFYFLNYCWALKR